MHSYVRLIESTYIESLNLTPISSSLLSTNPSYLHAFHESLNDIRGSHSSFDSYCAHLEGVARKIIWSTFFYYAFDFSMAFDEFKTPLTLFALPILVFSYLHHFAMDALAYDKLLRALATSVSKS